MVNSGGDRDITIVALEVLCCTGKQVLSLCTCNGLVFQPAIWLAAPLCSVLQCAVLCCAVLCCAVLCCAVLLALCLV